MAKAVVEVPATIGTAYRYLINHRRTVMRVGFVLFLVTSILSLLAEALLRFGNAGEEMTLVMLAALTLIGGFISVATATTLATAILWDAKPSTWFALRFAMIELQILLLLVALIGIDLLANAFLAPANLNGQNTEAILSGIALVTLLIFLAIRFSLAVPYSIAAGRFDPRASFEITRGNFWPLLLVFAIGLVPIVLLAFFVDGLVQHLRNSYAGFAFLTPLFFLVSAVANGAIQVIGVSLATALASFALLTIAPRPIEIKAKERWSRE